MALFGKETIEIGKDAPTMAVVVETGNSMDLSEVYAKGPTLVYFYPKADTPGCTKQACNLRDNFEALQDKGVQVIGVSSDSPASQMAFKEKYSLPFTLVADTDRELANAFGVGSIMGSGFSKRQSFLVVNGKVVWKDTSATPQTQSEDALKALEAVKS